MIKTEEKIINGTTFIYVYSDEGRYIICDGAVYEEVYHPVSIERTYTEGELIPIQEDEEQIDPEEAMRILLGEQL